MHNHPSKRPVPYILSLILLAFAGCGPSAAERAAQVAQAEKAEKARQAAAAENARQEAEAQKARAAAAAVMPAQFSGLAAARIDTGYVAVLFENGRRGMLPVASLKEAELDWVTAFAAEHPLAKGKSSVVVAKTEVKKTIEKQSVENGVETVQLCPPAKLRDQIGGTCMFYGRVHYLDIAGYPVSDGEIYRVINNVPKDEPYTDYRYTVGILTLFLKQKPMPLVHYPDGSHDPFEWARQELRKGRPVLAGLTEKYWITMPADFLATHKFDGNKTVGHQVVINGFTWNPATKKGSFHVVNSWRDLSEFDVTVDQKDEGMILIEQSISPRGEEPEKAVKLVVSSIKPLKAVGKQSLYEVVTNVGTQRVLAASEEAAKALVEADNTGKDAKAFQSDYINRVFYYINTTLDPALRDAALAGVLAEAFNIPPTVALPHVDFVDEQPEGAVYFVRVAPQKVVRMYAASPADALEKARPLVGPKG